MRALLGALLDILAEESESGVTDCEERASAQDAAHAVGDPLGPRITITSIRVGGVELLAPAPRSRAWWCNCGLLIQRARRCPSCGRARGRAR